MAEVELIEKTDREVYLRVCDRLGINQSDAFFQPKGVAYFTRTEDKSRVSMPFANLWREAPQLQNEMRYSHFTAIEGFPYGEFDEATGAVKERIAKLKLIPVMIPYTLDFWSTDRRTQNTVISNYMWWWKYEPIVEFTEHNVIEQNFGFNITFSDPQDASDIESKYTKGKVYRTTFKFIVNGALARVTDPDYATIFYVKARIYNEGLA